MYFFELEGCHLLFPIEGPKILNYSVTIRRLQAEQRGVEHGICFADVAQADQQVQCFFNDGTVGLRNFPLFLVERFLVVNRLIALREPRGRFGRAIQYGRKLQ